MRNRVEHKEMMCQQPIGNLKHMLNYGNFSHVEIPFFHFIKSTNLFFRIHTISIILTASTLPYLNTPFVIVQDYIAVKEKYATYLPHTAGRYAAKRFRKAQVTWQ